MNTKEEFAKTSIFIVHSFPLVRRGITCLLNGSSFLNVVGEAEDTASAIRGIHRMRPHVGLVELFSNVVDGILICKTIKIKGLATKVVLVAEDVVGVEVYKAVTAGADGYLTLHETPENILSCIRETTQGQISFVHPAQAVLQNYLQKQEVNAQAKIECFPPQLLLSHAELQILQFLAKGLSIRDTGQILHLSPSTVKNHRQSLFAKLGVRNAPAAVYSAIQRNILNC